MKIYNYFSIYTIRTEALKEFCDSSEIEYRKILSHSKTRWLSLFPCINRVLQMYPALQSYFQLQEHPPVLIKTYFENPLNESYLWFIHSLTSTFDLNIKNIIKEKNNIIEIMEILENVADILQTRRSQQFLPLKVKEIIKANSTDPKSDIIKSEFMNVYDRALEYLKNWMSSLEEFKNFKWMKLQDKPTWNEIEKSIMYLRAKNVIIDDVLLFYQAANLNTFVENMNGSLEFKRKVSSEKWLKYFEQVNTSSSSELLKICTFIFAIPSHNANVERVFSMMNAQWTDERNRFTVDSVKGLLMVKYNYKEFNCSEFYDYCLNNKKLLSDVRSSAKYN